MTGDADERSDTGLATCPSCGEPVLPVARRCKHCRSPIASASSLASGSAAAEVSSRDVRVDAGAVPVRPAFALLLALMGGAPLLLGVTFPASLMAHFCCAYGIAMFARGMGASDLIRVVAAIGGTSILAAMGSLSEKGFGTDSGQGSSAVAVEKRASGAPALTCSEDVTGRLAPMVSRFVAEFDSKTDVQKDSFRSELATRLGSAHYCARIVGVVEDVGTGLTGADLMSGCDTPPGLRGHVALGELDGSEYVSAVVYMTEEKARSFASLNKGDRFTANVFVYAISPTLNGCACVVLR
jgi:hypothetical protein